jgi:integrase
VQQPDRPATAASRRHRSLTCTDDLFGDGVTAHVGRHTFATAPVRGGTDLLGHARLDTVRAYTRPTEDDRTKALNLLLTGR